MSGSTENSKKASKANRILLEIIALSVWSFVILKLFIFDIDVFFVRNYSPHLQWILDYKFFVLIGIISIIWLIFGTKLFLFSLSMLFAYPFIWVFWRIPKLLFKSQSWIPVFTAVGLILTFFKSLKLNFVLFSLMAISCLLIVVTDEKVYLISAITVLGFFLLFHFVRRFYYSFNPARIFSLQSDALAKVFGKFRERLEIAEEIRTTEISKMSDEQKTKWATNIQFLLIINKFCYFLTTKLRNFQKSKVSVLYYMLGLIYTVFLTILIFSFQNYALYKIEPSSFSSPEKATFPFFVYYSFNTIFTNSINDFYPTGNWARMFNTFEIFFGFLIAIVLVSLITTVQREKHNQDLDLVVAAVDHQAKDLEKFVQKEFSLTVDQAIQEMENIKGTLINVIYYLTSNIEHK